MRRWTDSAERGEDGDGERVGEHLNDIGGDVLKDAGHRLRLDGHQVGVPAGAAIARKSWTDPQLGSSEPRSTHTGAKGWLVT